MLEVQNLERLIVQGIKSFKNDPPATDYERGYFNALKELLEDAGAPVPDLKHTRASRGRKQVGRQRR